MILDKGICTIFAVTGNSATSGNMPVEIITQVGQSWYGELEFASTPYAQDGMHEDVQIVARIRIHQNKAINPHNVVALKEVPSTSDVKFEVIRAFHGTDPENGQPITDLTLQKAVQTYGFA